MKWNMRLYALGVFLAFGISRADTTITNTELDYAIYLPDHWVMERLDSTQHYFFDTTGTYPALVSIVRYNRDPIVFATSEEWTRAHFIAYTMAVEYSAEPWGAVLYYDSSQSSRQQQLWAPEAYSMFFVVDTLLDSWAEYIRYTASGNYGYELYALGDTADLATNVGLYAAILQGIELPEESSDVRPRSYRTVSAVVPTPIAQRGYRDPLGRRLYVSPARNSAPAVRLAPSCKQFRGLP